MNIDFSLRTKNMELAERRERAKLEKEMRRLKIGESNARILRSSLEYLFLLRRRRDGLLAECSAALQEQVSLRRECAELRRLVLRQRG